MTFEYLSHSLVHDSSGDASVGASFNTFVDLLLERASRQPDKQIYTFLKGGETELASLTYGGLDTSARAIAAQLQTLCRPGDRALLLYQPGLDFVSAFLGCLYAGVIAVPAYPPRRNQSLVRLQSIIANAEAAVVLTTADLRSTLLERSDEEFRFQAAQCVATDSLPESLAQAWFQPDLQSQSLAFLQYTSGSTGDPKGVMVSHGNLLHNSAMIDRCFGHSQQSRGMIWLPPYHDMGLIGGILQPLYADFPVTLMAPVDFLQKPMRWLQAISRDRATTSGGPNFAYDLCCRKATPEQIAALDLSCWEVAFTGAEPVRAETLEEFARTFEPCGFRPEAFYPCYGMAESTLIITGGAKTALPQVCRVEGMALEQNRVVSAQPHQEDARDLVGCGQAHLGQRIAIVHPETLKPCALNQVGEIWVSGDSVAQGYWNQSELTTRDFRARLADSESNGETQYYLRTGDLGFIRDNELFITGRLKDVIIIRGQNHYPQDIELTVERSHSALRPGCGAAFTVDHKGAERLIVVHEVERSALRRLEVQPVVNSIRQAVAAQHGLDLFAVVLVKTGSIPKTSSGKIRRRACRSEFLANALEVVEDWSQSPQMTTRFINLQSEVDSILSALQGNRNA